MKCVQVESVQVSGVKVRTKNADEIHDDSARIGALWQRFGEGMAPKLTPDSQVYGVYCHYESDMNGEFDVYAASDVLSDVTGFESVTIQAGEYMVFTGKGEMPQAVIDVWMQVWRYFSEIPERQRAYTTDFELYKGEDDVEVYIALK